MFHYIDIDIILEKLEMKIFQFDSDSAIFKFYLVVCNDFGSFKTALFDYLKKKEIYLIDDKYIYIRNEKRLKHIFKVLRAITEILQIKINFICINLNLEVKPSVKELKLNDPVEIRLGEEDLVNREERIPKEIEEKRTVSIIYYFT